jgi:hypothetical protein
MVTTDPDPDTLTASLAGYARRLHAVIGDRHHVASPLGAWLLLALCGPATGGADRGALTQVLGCDVEAAARIAADLLSSPHPLVASAAAVWTRRGSPLSGGFPAWQSGLPAAVQTGALPGQAELDAWARDHTFGLIERFPLRVDPAVRLILATALATRVSWQVPFALAPARDLGAQSPWPGSLSQVLRTPRPGPGRSTAHRQFIAVTPEAGDVAVHLAQAQGGLLVASVAAAADVASGDVLAAAQRLGSACAIGGPVQRRPLAELPLGAAPLWVVREESGPGGSEDAFTAVLPAWSARSKLPLTDPSLGFGPAVRALAGGGWDAAQAAMARYSRTGFEAAAVTAVMAMSAVRAPRPGRRRAAELRFGHPYAVVAVAVDERRLGPWHGVPVFSAWVTDPEEATADEPAPGGLAASRPGPT